MRHGRWGKQARKAIGDKYGNEGGIDMEGKRDRGDMEGRKDRGDMEERRNM